MTRHKLRKMRKTKGALFTMRMQDDQYAQFRAVGLLRGSDISNLVHQFAIEQIRREKERDPEAFDAAVKQAKIEIKEHQEKKRAESRNKRLKPLINHAASGTESNTEPED